MSADQHARPTGRSTEPLYDVTIPTPTHAERARTLAARVPTGTLCTVAIEPPGYPYGSFVTIGFDGADPVFLISALAEHTRNLESDARASLLIAEGGADDPLANGRVTLIGRCTPTADEDGRARRAFLATHPNAGYYADFRDFGFWRLHVEAVRYIGGYGRMSWVTEAEWQAAEPDPLAAAATGIIAHMNGDHSDALVLYCRAFSKATQASAATMTGVDRYGFEMSATTSDGPRPVRIAFARPVATPQDVRAAMVAMVQEARTKLA